MTAAKLGGTMNEILDAFKRVDRENCGRRITEAHVVGGSLRFRWQGNGKLGVVVGEMGIRDATDAEYSKLEEGVELGEVQIYTAPLYASGQNRVRTVLHQATGRPIDPNSDAARRQWERWARAEMLRKVG